MTVEWYPHYILDYRRDTLHLTTLEHGAYRLLIDAYMELGRALPNDDLVLSRIVGMDLADWQTISETIKAFFVLQDSLLNHKRCEHELDAQSQQRKRWLQLKRAQRANKALKYNKSVPGGLSPNVSQLSSDTTLQYNIKKDARAREDKNGLAGKKAEQTNGTVSNGNHGGGGLTMDSNEMAAEVRKRRAAKIVAGDPKAGTDFHLPKYELMRMVTEGLLTADDLKRAGLQF